MSDDELREMREEIRDIREKMAEIREWKAVHSTQSEIDAPIISVLRIISGFSKGAQWLVGGIIGILAAIATIGVAVDTIKSWFEK